MSKFLQLYEDLFKSATPEEVMQRQIEYGEEEQKEWLEEFLKREDIHKNPDGSYDVDGNVDISETSFNRFPIKFNRVGGGFFCYGCTNLTSLQGSPESVGGSFEGADCESLTSLQGAPKSVGGHFSCEYCINLTSLKGGPKMVGKDFYCTGCAKDFAKDEVRNICDVGGEIYVL